MAEHLPTTEIRALTSPSFGSNETNDLTTTSPKEINSQQQQSPTKPSAIARMFTEANLHKTHTQHEIQYDPEPQHKQIQLADLNHVVSNSTVTSQTTQIDSEQNTLREINKGTNAVNIAIHSKEKKLCSFMPTKCNCSDRLTMQKTKFVIYLFPFFLLCSCFSVLVIRQNISQNSAFMIACLLLSSYIIGWICILCVLCLLQLILIIRDAVFWCIVSEFVVYSLCVWCMYEQCVIDCVQTDGIWSKRRHSFKHIRVLI